MMMDAATRRRLWLRSLLLQSTWNFESMQGLGFLWGVEPFLARAYPDAAALRAARSRHLEYFNTNPYFAPLVVGMTCALEEEAASLAGPERETKLARIGALKKAAASPLAGLGDVLFWQTLRPFCAAVALLAGLYLWRSGTAAAPAAMALCYLALYNAPSINARRQGFALGYEWRDQIAVRLKRYPWQSWIKALRWGGTGLAVLLMIFALAGARLPIERLAGILATLAFLIADRVALRPVSAAKLYSGVVAFGTLAACAGWI
jgi:mannose/fructose/N-acetylgalactosamine-specific phosphotransferase system component IID